MSRNVELASVLTASYDARMDEPLLARFGSRDLPETVWPEFANRPPTCLVVSSLALRFEVIAHNICEACPKSADRTLALRALLDARRHAIDSLLYAGTPQ